MRMKPVAAASPASATASICAGLLLLILTPGTGIADFLLFPTATYEHRANTNEAPGMPGHMGEGHQDNMLDTLRPSINLFYTKDGDRLRILAELMLTPQEGHPERLQIGYRLRPETTIWAGQFHNPMSYWNTQFHHGEYLTTSISHPGMDTYEHDGGVLTTHLSGALLESKHQTGGSAISIALALGTAAWLDMDSEHILQATNIAKPNHVGHFFASGRLAWHPDPDGPSEFGLFAGHAEIPVDHDPMLSTVKQQTSGLYGNWDNDHARILGSLYLVRNQLVDPMGMVTDDRFSSGYLQGEYLFGGSLTTYGRVERSSNTADDVYLSRFPEIAVARSMAGLRYELGERQALKLEASRVRTQNQEKYTQFMTQWSMVLP